MKVYLKKIERTAVGYYFIHPLRYFYSKFKMIFVSDEVYICKKYKRIFNEKLDVSNPKKFTEKIQWLKLYDRNPLLTKCADKLAVREYIKDKIGEEYLIPLVLSTNNPKNINRDNLPDYPVVIKTNHDSGGVYFVKDKEKVSFDFIQKDFRARLKKNFYYQSREWEYKNIKPCLVVEKLIQDESGNEILNDYKIHCFNGKPMYIQTIFDRQTEVKEDWYDTNWNLLDISYFSNKRKNLPRPELLEKLLKTAEILSNDFIYVRVDLYTSFDKIYFGELTFRPYGGFMKFKPSKYNLILGEQLILPFEKSN